MLYISFLLIFNKSLCSICPELEVCWSSFHWDVIVLLKWSSFDKLGDSDSLAVNSYNLFRIVFFFFSLIFNWTFDLNSFIIYLRWWVNVIVFETKNVITIMNFYFTIILNFPTQLILKVYTWFAFFSCFSEKHKNKYCAQNWFDQTICHTCLPCLPSERMLPICSDLFVLERDVSWDSWELGE